VVVVPQESPLTSMKQLVDVAQKEPGKLTYGSAGNGSASHLATLLLADTAKLEMVHVPYKGAGPAITDTIGGRLDFMITTLPSVAGFIKSGKVKALAVTTKARSKSLPDVPTIAESGWADYNTGAWYGFVVPKGTPAEVTAKLREATVESLKGERVRASLEIEGAEPVGNTPEEFATFMQGESKRWADLIQKTGLTTD
jgi:tripartite-type tricarboxylate transporter receptor subunit TctC